MTLDRALVAQLVPQAGDMCLLDGVTRWDATSIACFAAAPGPAHPLVRRNALPAVAGCEYAAQATAVHGALLDGATPKAGMLVKLMDVDLRKPCFALTQGPLEVRAELASRTEAGCLYGFEVTQEGQAVVSGRLMVAFTPAASVVSTASPA
jgi:predicted hotdog family 3-hydroxylacyl-ACP dehydratase